MPSIPNISDPGRIDPQAPPEAPTLLRSPDMPGAEPPEIAPASPEFEQPGAHPGGWQPLEIAMVLFPAWWSLLRGAWTLPAGDLRRSGNHHDRTVPEPIDESGEKALFA